MMVKIDTSVKTGQQLQKVVKICRTVFCAKMEDYGTSWRIMRPMSLTDQIYIKACRIRRLEEGGEQMIPEGIVPEFIGIVNYCVMALIQLRLGPGERLDHTEALALYDEELQKSVELLLRKNHDYDEAWRLMRVSSYTDIILQKLLRTKEIEAHCGETKVSEGVEANYMDMINYALFALIKLHESDPQPLKP